MLLLLLVFIINTVKTRPSTGTTNATYLQAKMYRYTVSSGDQQSGRESEVVQMNEEITPSTETEPT